MNYEGVLRHTAVTSSTAGSEGGAEAGRRGENACIFYIIDHISTLLYTASTLTTAPLWGLFEGIAFSLRLADNMHA